MCLIYKKRSKYLYSSRLIFPPQDSVFLISQSVICKLEVDLSFVVDVDENGLEVEISMKKAVLVEVVQSGKNFGYEVGRLSLIHLFNV